jgi:signal peptide peptidase SppA
MNYPRLASRVFNTPLLIHPQKLDAILAGLGPRLLGLDAPLILQPGADGASLLPADMFSTKRGDRKRADGSAQTYSVVDGVAVFHIDGALVHRGRMEGASSYLLGYDDLALSIEAAMADPEANAILLEWNSPGGEAQGAFEFADRIFALRGKKPMVSIADGLAASAAILGASAADELVVTNTGYVGSIGVVMRHVDLSQALAKEGISVTHIFAGAHKVDGNPYEPLPAAVRADYQAEIDGLMGLFVETMVRQTGLSADAIRKTQAATYRGVAAVATGLASRIGTTDQLITELAALRSRSYPSGQTARATANQGDSMSGTPTPGGQPSATSVTPSATAFTQADVDRAQAQGHAAGVTAERERVGAILGHERAAANMAMAQQLINTGLTTEQSSAILGAMPEQFAAVASAVPGNAFAAAMAAVGNPAVSGVEAAGGEALEGDDAAAAHVLAAFRMTKAKA